MPSRSSAAAHTHRPGAIAVLALLASVAAGLGCTEKVSLGAWVSTDTGEVTSAPTTLPTPPPPASTPAGPVTNTPPVLPPRDAGPSPLPEPEASPSIPDASVLPRLDASVALPIDSAAPSDGGFPSCEEEGTPGRLNRAGGVVGPTITYTDWAWPQPLDSVEFELRVEREPVNNLAFWAYQFGFVSGIGGLFGLQANGGYQAEPPGGTPEWTKMALLWIAGPPLDAELGDTQPPDARVAPEYSKGLAWTSIHLKYPWEVCRVYRFRLAFESTNADGDRWYGAWITDTAAEQTTYVGRMLAPQEWGQLSVSSSMWTDGLIDPQNLDPQAPTCADLEPVSAVFSAPVGNDGTVEPLSFNNRFDATLKCGSSRFTVFSGAVRQEQGATPAL